MLFTETWLELQSNEYGFPYAESELTCWVWFSDRFNQMFSSSRFGGRWGIDSRLQNVTAGIFGQIVLICDFELLSVAPLYSLRVRSERAEVGPRSDSRGT